MLTNHCYISSVNSLKESSLDEGKQAADAIEKLVTTLLKLTEEIENHGDFDSQFGVGEALDQAWLILDPLNF